MVTRDRTDRAVIASLFGFVGVVIMAFAVSPTHFDGWLELAEFGAIYLMIIA
jgi:hypothetical protein